MLAAALLVGLGIQYRQLEGTVEKMIGESRTPFLSQLRKRMGRLDVGTYQGGVMTVPDPRHSRILAADATGLTQHNRGEWIGKKWSILAIQAHIRRTRDVPQAVKHHSGDASRGGPVQQADGRIDSP